MTKQTETVTATLRVALKLWDAPSFAIRSGMTDETRSVSVRDLDDDALEDLALAWLRDLYRKAGRSRCPFYAPTKAEAGQ